MKKLGLFIFLFLFSFLLCFSQTPHDKLKARIDTAIYQNTQHKIRGDTMNAVLNAMNDSYWNLISTGSGSLGWLLSGNSGTTGANFIGTIGATPLKFRAKNVEYIRIDTVGNIGFHTISATKAFQVNSYAGYFTGGGHAKDSLSFCDSMMVRRITATLPTAWGLTGNSGTSPGTNFIGTTDNVGLVFKINNSAAGIMTPSLSNCSFGYLTLQSITSGQYNTSIGQEALRNMNTGDKNTGIGYGSLHSNSTGTGNVGIGNYAGYYQNGAISNEFYINNQDRTNAAGDTTKSLLYGKFTSAGTTNQWLRLNGSLKIVDGTQGNGKVLTSDASGKASWGTISASLTNSVTPIASGTVGSILVHGTGDVLTEYNSKLFWNITNSQLGVGTASPVAKIDAVTTNSLTTGYSIGIRNSNGNYLFGGDNRGHFGINGNGGTFNQGVINDGTLEILQCSNMDGQYGLIVKDSTRGHVQFRTNYGTSSAPTLQLGDADASTIYDYGVTGFGIAPSTDFRIYSKGTGNSSATFNFVSVNSDATNLFHIRNDGLIMAFKFLTTNPFGTNALSPTAYVGQAAFNCNTNVPQANVADAGGSFNITCLAASAVNVGPQLTGYANYDSGLYPMGDIGFKRENGTAGNSAGYLEFSTHTTATGGLTPWMRITSTGGIAFNGASNYGASGQILTSNGNAPPTWNTNISNVATTYSTALTFTTGVTSPQTILTYTSSATDNFYRVSGTLNITAISLDHVALQVIYTDETNTSNTTTIFLGSAGLQSSFATSTGANGGIGLDIRVKASTVITIQVNPLVGTGSATFNAGAVIQKE